MSQRRLDGVRRASRHWSSQDLSIVDRSSQVGTGLVPSKQVIKLKHDKSEQVQVRTGEVKLGQVKSS